MKKLLVSGICCAALLRADFQISNWRYRRALSSTASSTAVVILDRAAYAGAQPNQADLRIANGEGAEVAYAIEKVSGTHGSSQVSSKILNRGVTPSNDLELTVDVGAGHRHNGIRLATEKTNFRQRVTISTSDDQRTWTRVRDDGYIFDFSEDGRHVAVLDVTYSDSSRRFVRVTIQGWTDPKAVSQCWAMLNEDRPAVRDAVASLRPEPQQEPKTQSTLYTWDLAARIPHDELSVAVTTAAFYRAAAVESSDDGKQWSPLGSGAISRIGQQESLSLNFPENHQRYLRLRIYNRDDQPLAVTEATLSVTRTRVRFKPSAGGSYWLYYGNPDAPTPVYDLQAVLAREAPGSESAAGMGAEERNPAFREKPVPEKPWSERHPAILYIVLAIAVVGMGAITLRLLSKARSVTNS